MTLTPAHLELIDQVDGFIELLEENGLNTDLSMIINNIHTLEEDIHKYIGSEFGEDTLMSKSEKEVFYKKINDSFDDLSTLVHSLFLTNYADYRQLPISTQTQVLQLVEVIDEIWNMCAVLTYDFSKTK